ncbi:hypothetical protein [Streptomyces antimicrobicus]|uniref:Uncharacterized protein n=1 Tax=Streptomyces antimicrobicus TaxID=2883108 RepID=A0ABS8B6X1_9ACTN|nr:hypothetical protein [Streptomyces antimicrobicus]MCB5180363.1 hypothetical protein [Streptomyces antimicrobicus]
MLSALWALAALAALAGPALLRLRRAPAFLTGRDGRLSTSTTLAFAWTVILVWLLVTILGYGLVAGGGTSYFHGPDGPLSSLTTVYLPLLGGPYVALIAAKAVVGIRVQHGTLSKPALRPGARPTARDLIANDGGRTDLVDLQYVVLSAVTMAYVVAFFLADVRAGLPDLPDQIWALTGAPAGAYLVNKLAARPNPVITRVTRTTEGFVIEGGGFDADTTHGNPKVTVDTLPPVVATPTPDGTLFVPSQGTSPDTPATLHVTARGLRSDPYHYTPNP